MDVAVVVALLGLWAAILLPGLVRARHQGSPSASVSRFHGNLALLERTSCPGSARGTDERGAPSGPAPSRAAARRRACARRRVIVGTLLGGLLGSLAAVPLLGWVAWTLAALLAGAVVAYIATWRWLVARRALARRVSHLPRQAAAEDAAPVDVPRQAAGRGDERIWAAAAGEDPRWR